MFYLLHPSKPARFLKYQITDNMTLTETSVEELSEPTEGLGHAHEWLPIALRSGEALPGWLAIPAWIPDYVRTVQQHGELTKETADGLRRLGIEPGPDYFEAAEAFQRGENEEGDDLREIISRPVDTKLEDHWKNLKTELS